MTSIIVVAYDKSHIRRQITSACLGNIEKYTDSKDYELILIDQKPCELFSEERDRFGTAANFHFSIIDKYIVLKKHIGYSAANNLGAQRTKGEYLCFIHNDVFVPENWLPKLRYYLDTFDIVAPHQGPTSYEEMKNLKKGHYDAGLLLITRKAFDKTKGWDKDFKVIYPGYTFVNSCQNKYGLNFQCIPDVTITHLGQLIDTGNPGYITPRYKKLIQRENRLLHEKGYIK